MEFKRVLEHAHAVRGFKDKQVPVDKLREIIEEAMEAPSWMDAQERKVYIATDDTAAAIRSEYAELAAAQTPDRAAYPMGHHSDWSEAAQKNMAHMEETAAAVMGEQMSDFIAAQGNLFGAPAIVWLTLPKKPAPWGILDLGAFEEAIVLSAADKGISSIVAYAFTKYPDVVRKHIAIPEDEDIVIGIGLGYKDDEARINKVHAGRVSVDEILTIN